jgi:hypothetical protein
MTRMTIGSVRSAANADPAVLEDEAAIPAYDGLITLVEETGIDDFIDRAPKDRAFSPTMEHGFGMCFRRKEYGPSHPYVTDHGIRKEATREAQEKNPTSQLEWHEAIGVIDVGSGVGGTVPLMVFDAAFVALYYGFYCSAMLRYRKLGLGAQGQSDIALEMPTSALKAAKMKKGDEVEFVGQGKVNTGVGLMAGTGVVLGPFAAGVAVVTPVTVEGVREYSLTVTGVDGKGKVRVILRRLNSTQETASLLAVAGLISPGFDGPDLTSNGTLIFLAGNTSTVKSTNLMLEYTSAGIGLSGSHLEKSAVLSAFDLDLNQADAAIAYEELLRLSPQKAYSLAKKPDSGVEMATVREKECDVIASASFNFFGEKLLLLESIDGDRDGKMVRRDGTQLNYKEKIFEKRSRNFLAGKKNIAWEAASFQDANKDPELYFRLSFERSDYDFVKSRFERLMRFFQALDIPRESLSNNSGQSLEAVLDLFVKSAKIETKVDVFFSNEAIRHIETCKKESASNTYIQAMRNLHPKYAGFPLDERGTLPLTVHKLLETYVAGRSSEKFFGLIGFKENSELRARYTALTGRIIDKDVQLFKDAQAFGNEVEHLRSAREKGQAEHFFSRLGKMRGFKFMATILALRMIGGKTNTFVHELSLSGRGIRLGYDSELVIKGPRDLIYDELTACAARKI